ncbi:MAG: shikimate kinase [Cryobacterium sp.]|jgi:shikimate kinase|nr:shikimate kinase [Cryobacterium sp.]
MTEPGKALFPLVFIGPMAAGKTKIGKRVARALAIPFIDTDKRIVAAYGPIADLFEREGEDYFRVLEREAVVEALREEAVVSLGGGAVLNPHTRADLADCSVVFLSTTLDAVRSRIHGGKRPLLKNGIENWQRIFDERLPIYESLASIRIDTSKRPIDAIAADIVTWVREKS